MGRSPFRQPSSRRFGFRTILLMMLMVTVAGVSILVYNALRVPAIMEDLYAWMGRPAPAVRTGDARRAQLLFALFCYAAPLTLALLVHLLHTGLQWWEAYRVQRTAAEDESYRME